MVEQTSDVQAHWTRPGVLARIDAALTELGHDPQTLSPEILPTLEHLHYVQPNAPRFDAGLWQQLDH